MDRKIILRIKIDGKNWNELINLPCVQGLTKGDERIIKDESKRTPHVHLYDGYMPEELRLQTAFVGAMAFASMLLKSTLLIG